MRPSNIYMLEGQNFYVITDSCLRIQEKIKSDVAKTNLSIILHLGVHS